MRSRITELLGIEYPVIQGGMARVADGRLARAVSAAGGLGVIGAGSAPLSWVVEQIGIVREATDKPFGVNVMLMSPFAEEISDYLADNPVPVITSGAGNPGKYVEAWKEAGTVLIPVVASTALARRMERSGADAVIAEGQEAGGHIGELTTMALVPAVTDVVDIPVIAAGGIADGRGLAAAIALGAEGIQMGTRFLTVDEAWIDEEYKERVLKAKDIDTSVVGRSTGHPLRILRNKFSRQIGELEAKGCSIEEFEEANAGALFRACRGDCATGAIMAGQVAALVSERGTASDVVSGIVKDAESILGDQAQTILDANARRARR